jgi:hypothetical protein
MIFVRRTYCVLLSLAVVALPRAFSCDNNNICNPPNPYDEAEYSIPEVIGAPPWESVPQTTYNSDEYSKIADEAIDKLAKVFVAYGNELTCDLFVEHFDAVKKAVVGMIYPYEKEGIIHSYLVGILGRGWANDFTDDLNECECYNKLFDTSECEDYNRICCRLPSDDCDDGAIKIGGIREDLVDNAGNFVDEFD